MAVNEETCKDVFCQWWNHVSLLIKHYWRPTTKPWLLLAENTEQNPSCLRKMFDLGNNKCHSISLPETFGARCLGSGYGWVALVQRDFSVQLFNPITKAQILYPSLESLIPYVAPDFDKNKEEDIMWFLNVFVMKLVVIKVPRGGQDEFFVMASNYNCLFFARHGDQSWTLVLHHKLWLKLSDIVAVDDHVFAIHENGKIIYWNVMDLYDLGVIKPMDYFPGQPKDILRYGVEKMYLVQSVSDLLMVIRYKEEMDSHDYYYTIAFKVYRVDIKDKSWEEIDDLGDMALFVGNNSSMSVSKAFSKGLKRGIYFTDDECTAWGLPKEFGGHDMGVYDLKSGNISPFYEGDDMRSSFCPPTFFFT